MSTENIANSLGAVAEALHHLASSLESAGFLENASTYEKMTEVVAGQRYWLAQNEIHEFDAKFSELAAVAARIRLNIEPYLEVTSRLQALGALDAGLGGSYSRLQPDEIKLVRYLEASKPLSVTQLGKATALPTRTVQALLQHLISEGWVQAKRSGGRTRYVISHDRRS